MVWLAIAVFAVTGGGLSALGLWAIMRPDRYVDHMLWMAYLGRVPPFARRRYEAARRRRVVARVHGVLMVAFGIAFLYAVVVLALKGGRRV